MIPLGGGGKVICMGRIRKKFHTGKGKKGGRKVGRGAERAKCAIERE